MNSTPSAEQTVFIVDDDPEIRNSLRLLMEMTGLAVRTFSSAASFLGGCKPSETGCLIVDIRMPEMSGLDLRQELIRRGFNLPIIVLTGFADVPSAVRALKNGAVEFLEKPVEEDVLLGHVRRALTHDARHRLLREADAQTSERISRLTRREREILSFVVDGLSSKEIRQRLNVTYKTIEAHRLRMMRKVEAESVADLVRMVSVFESREAAKSATNS